MPFAKTLLHHARRLILCPLGRHVPSLSRLRHTPIGARTRCRHCNIGLRQVGADTWQIDKSV